MNLPNISTDAIVEDDSCNVPNEVPLFQIKPDNRITIFTRRAGEGEDNGKDDIDTSIYIPRVTPSDCWCQETVSLIPRFIFLRRFCTFQAIRWAPSLRVTWNSKFYSEFTCFHNSCIVSSCNLTLSWHGTEEWLGNLCWSNLIELKQNQYLDLRK